ncbi:hypothetical protein [Yoonia sp.]
MTQKKSVSGITATAPRPTILGAAVVAAIITFPIGVTIQVIALILL